MPIHTEQANGTWSKTNTKNFTPRRSRISLQQNLNKLKKADKKTLMYFFIFVLICILFGAGYFFKDKIKSFFKKDEDKV